MLAFLGTAALAFAQVPTGADVQCVINGMSADAAAALVAEVNQGNSQLSEAASNPIKEAADACRVRGKWSKDHAANAGALAMASLMGAAAKEQLEQAGISVNAINSWLEARPESVQASLNLAEADVMDLGKALEAAGVSEEKLSANGQAIGTYLASMLISQRIGRGLAID
jgi:hypothetical protein